MVGRGRCRGDRAAALRRAAGGSAAVRPARRGARTRRRRRPAPAPARHGARRAWPAVGHRDPRSRRRGLHRDRGPAPLLLQSERALSPTLAGGILTFGAIGWSVGAWLRGKAHWGWSHAQFVLIGSLFVAGGISGTVLLAWAAVPPIVGMLAWTFAGLGMGLVHPTLSVLTLALSPRTSRARTARRSRCPTPCPRPSRSP